MKQRYLVVAVGLPLLLAVLLACPAWATVVLVGGISCVAAYELLKTAGKTKAGGIFILGGILINIICQYYFRCIEQIQMEYETPDFSGVQIMRWFIMMVLFFAAVKTYGSEEPFTFRDVTVGIVASIVFPAMYSCIFLLRMHETFGKVYVLAPFFIAFAGDSLSMYFGMWFGKRKMAPHVSPNKTWAGFIGGPVGSALGMCLLGFIGAKCFGYAPNYLALIGVGAVGNVLGQLGDLSMSLIKREAGIKDYSHLFLTHGGMLDRFDSSMFIAPVVYFFVSAGVI